MIVARSTTLRFKFAVGKKYVLVEVNLRQGEDSEEALRAFFVQEDIPVYLEIPILATADRLLKDPALGEQDREAGEF